MTKEQYNAISHLEGIEFVKALLEIEKERFQPQQFMKGSTFEDINTDFGIFPTMPAYPIYFAGDITKPKDKIIFVGINPGFNSEGNTKEQTFLNKEGLFEGYCQLFSDFRYERKKGLLPYYANIAGFLKRYFDIQEKIDWDWYQRHFITLELIPYHSTDSSGLRINDIAKYRAVYFEIILKLLRYLNPKQPIFLNGFPSYKNLILKNPLFEDVITYTEHEGFSTGKLDGYNFIGLPFLNRPRGGKDALVLKIKQHFLN